MNDKKKQILEGIKLGKVRELSDDISLSDLLSVDENNVSYLEYALKNAVDLSRKLSQEVLNNYQALCICITRNLFNYIWCPT